MFDSPLRYPGGKGRLAQYLIDLIEMNGLTGGHYVEPYAGGAGLAITLLYLEYVGKIHLNDLNPSIHAFWKSVLEQPDELCRLILSTPLSVEQWQIQRAVQTSKDAEPLALGFSTFFLNRTNRSGIINGGIIGGKNQDGRWKLDARYNSQELVRRISKIARFAPRITLHNLDASVFLKSFAEKLPKRQTLIYLDPPYYSNGKRLYENKYRPEDHINLSQLVGKLGHRWIVSYDDTPPIRAMYSKFRQQTFELLYSARRRYTGAEVMIFSDALKIPGQVQPWRGIAA